MRERDRERLGAEHDEINYQGDNQDWPEWEAEPESHDQNCEDGEHCSLLRWFIVLLTIALICITSQQIIALAQLIL